MPALTSAMSGESLLASLGLEAVLKPGKLRINTPHRDAAEKWESGETFAKELKRYLRSTDNEEATKAQPFDYEATMELISAPIDINHLTEKFSGGDADAILALTMAASVAAEYVKGVAPRNTRLGVLGPINEPPSDFTRYKFSRVWAIVQDPREVFRQLHSGRLGTEEVRALEHCFPESYDAIRSAVMGALIDLKAEKPKLEDLPRDKGKGLAVLLGVKPYSPEFFSALQQNFVGQDETAPAQGGGAKLAMNPDSVQTSTQRTALK